MTQTDRVIAFVLMFIGTAVLSLCVLIAVLLVRANADEAKPSWSPHVIVSIKGDHMAFTRSVGFDTQEECEAHLQTSQFMRELQEIAKRVVPLDDKPRSSPSPRASTPTPPRASRYRLPSR